jgi:hypothetical protein
MSGSAYTLPPSAQCPGCGTIIVLPAEPIFPDTPPAICANCRSVVPDYRRETYEPVIQGAVHLPPAPRHFVTAPPPRAAAPRTDEVPPEERRYSRGKLFRSIGGLIAERGAVAVESAKGKVEP